MESCGGGELVCTVFDFDIMKLLDAVCWRVEMQCVPGIPNA
jgi:hypothetical protein